jgi:hypothetical protein
MRSWNKTHGASDRDVGKHDRDRPGGGSKQKASGGDERRLAQKSQATTLLRYCFEDIATCGGDIPFDPSEPNPQKTYTLNFGSTSGATAIVARAAVLLQSWVVKELGSVFDTVTRRALWFALDLNTRSKTPCKDQIGVMPDLNRIILHLILKRTPSRWGAIISILIGDVIHGGGGWRWTPGGGLTPAGPRVDRVPLRRLSADERDASLGSRS